MSNPNFASILDESPTEAHDIPLIPQGTYTAVVQGAPRYDKSTKKGTEFIEFTLKLIAAEDDVDADELDNIGGIEDKSIKATFYYENDYGLRGLDLFHQHCGIDLGDGQTRRQRSDDCMNAEVRIFVKHEPSQDGTRMFARFNRSLPME